MNKTLFYPIKLYTFEYKHLLFKLVFENPNHHFNLTPYPLKRIMKDTIKKELRELDEYEKSFFEEINKVISSKVERKELLLLYRGTNKNIYPNIARSSDIKSVSNFFDNYIHGLEKGFSFLSLSSERPDKMNNVSDEVFLDLFQKIEISLDTYESEDNFKRYFEKDKNQETFLSEISNLKEEEKIRLKDYYSAYLHTVGSKEIGKPFSYFVSTTKSISIGVDFLYRINKEHQVLTYYLLPIPYAGSAIDSHTNISLDELQITQYFPRYEALHSHEDEVSIKGGLFPHHILGVRCFIDDNEVFLVNPYLFIGGKSIEDMLIEGIPVNQIEVNNQIKRNELHLVYKDRNHQVFEP